MTIYMERCEMYHGKVILHVHDWSEIQEAQRAAYSVPGIIEVEDRLCVVWCSSTRPNGTWCVRSRHD